MTTAAIATSIIYDPPTHCSMDADKLAHETNPPLISRGVFLIFSLKPAKKTCYLQSLYRLQMVLIAILFANAYIYAHEQHYGKRTKENLQ